VVVILTVWLLVVRFAPVATAVVVVVGRVVAVADPAKSSDEAQTTAAARVGTWKAPMRRFR
jgi:hypothetical protein